MNEKDDATLEYLSEVGSAESLSVIYWNMVDRNEIGFSKYTLRRRLRRLVETGLVETPRGANSEKDTYYRITSVGEEYLCGEVKPEELPREFEDE